MLGFAWLAPGKNPEPAVPRRFWLWIDGVGGYLVCLGPRVVVGQATPDSDVDIPLLADVSRKHASLMRDSEGYLLEAVKTVRVNGQSVDRTLLRNGDRLTLGKSCQLEFRQPAAVSASARIEVASGHRLPLSANGVLLMADTLLLGPGTQVHVNLPEAKNNVVLFRSKDGLSVRCSGGLRVDGRHQRERALLAPASKVSGEDFAFALEPVATKIVGGL